MTPPQIKERIQAILDGCEGVTPGPWVIEMEQDEEEDLPAFYVSSTVNTSCNLTVVAKMGEASLNDRKDAAHIARLDPDTMRTICTLALRGLDATANEPGEAVGRAQQAYDILVSGEPPFSEWECKASYALSQTPGLRLSSHPAPQDGVPAPVVDAGMREPAFQFDNETGKTRVAQWWLDEMHKALTAALEASHVVEEAK